MQERGDTRAEGSIYGNHIIRLTSLFVMTSGFAGSSVPVLASSSRTLELCLYVGNLMQALPPFADRLAALWLLILAEYHRCTLTVYEEVIFAL